MARKSSQPRSKSRPKSSRQYRNRKTSVELGPALVDAFLTNEQINQSLLKLIDSKIWRTPPPCTKRKNIATTFAHIHNVRCMRLKMSLADTGGIPDDVDRNTVSKTEMKKALTSSARAMTQLIEGALNAGGHVRDFRPDVVALVCLACTHDAYHRGQICHWARQLDSPISAEDELVLWEWDKRWLEIRTPSAAKPRPA